MNFQDETTRQARNRRRIVSVYFLPIMVAFLFCGISFLLTKYFELDFADKIFGYLIGISLGIALYFRNRFKWLPLPDDSYINMDELSDGNVISDNSKGYYAAEPSTYVAEFSYLISSKILSIISGLVMICAGLYILSSTSVILPLLVVAGGFFVSYTGYKEFRDSSPKLKVAKSGLWTKELGFRTWSSILKTELKVESSGRYSTTYLEIYLKDNEIDYPDQRLPINDLKNSKIIKQTIDELINK
jgi:hypothetical protein